ncbi:MAG: HlyD family efflux transporter periplasmic adaptor subunit [Phycisphaerae bacterium]|nr:HlyD family efflux transporter periplasmic adaptor subunit [Phycisphaerae bacterium]
MIRTFLIPILAIAGIVLAAYTVVQGAKPPPAQPPAVAPPEPPFPAFVAASGLIEASSQNIAVGSPVGAVVLSVGVEVGAGVEKDQPLFQLEDAQQQADLTVRQAALAIAEAQLAKLREGTRPEQIPPARARVAEAEAVLADAVSQLEKWERLNDPRAVSEDDLSRRRFAAQAARARLEAARADLALLEAGTWSPEIAVARAEVDKAAAEVRQAQTEIDRRTVRSPVKGRVLQVNIRAGEFAPAGSTSTPLMLVGTVNPLHVRADVDEHEAWRVRADTAASAYVKGNKDINFPLTFVRFEPFVVPKKSLTGDSQERVDTRVLQVIYSFNPGVLPVFVGQQVDVYIESNPVHSFEPSPEQAQ